MVKIPAWCLRNIILDGCKMGKRRRRLRRTRQVVPEAAEMRQKEAVGLKMILVNIKEEKPPGPSDRRYVRE